MSIQRVACLGDLHICDRKTREIGKIIKVYQYIAYYENRPISVVGDLIQCKRSIIKTLTGSRTCYINNKAVHRLLDLNTEYGYCVRVTPTAAVE
jgi:hypothetical protein